jgi:hypothetical protein
VTSYYKHTDELPSVADIKRWVAGYPDEEQLAEIISRSYDYIQKLPLSKISKEHTKEDLIISEFSEE